MDGVINVFKPLGLTSARTLDRVRRITGQRKSGHAGTLDPLADGVLVVCLGRATRLVERVMDHPKMYRATARLDVASDSLDAECELRPVPIARVPDEAAVRAAAARLTGEFLQAPPARSALKVRGRPAYRLARRGADPALSPRLVTVYWLALRRFAWPEVEFEMACGRGTYVRSLARDLGALLGVGGCLTRLTRTAVGPFRETDAWTLERLESAGGAAALIELEPAEQLLAHVRVPEPPPPAAGPRPA